VIGVVLCPVPGIMVYCIVLVLYGRSGLSLVLLLVVRSRLLSQCSIIDKGKLSRGRWQVPGTSRTIASAGDVSLRS
jgi:hypothetical protein